MRPLLFVKSVLLLSLPASLQAKESESYYQSVFCTHQGGVVEYVLPDKTRVDCLTDEEAIEVDFAPKWAEAIGQSLLYARMTNKKPAVLLIVNEKSAPYLTRFHNASDGLGIKLYTVKEVN